MKWLEFTQDFVFKVEEESNEWLHLQILPSYSTLTEGQDIRYIDVFTLYIIQLYM